jgi:serine/arginine repetitive matrix protein 1
LCSSASASTLHRALASMSHARQPFSRGAVVTGKAAKRSIVKHPAELNRAVDTRRVRWEIVKPWIATRVTELLTVEDDVLIAMIYNLLEQDAIHKTGVYLFSQLQTFLEKDTETFMTELWDLLVSANANPSGIPQRFIDEKANELRRQKTVADELRGRQRESDEKTAAARRDVKREVPVKTETDDGRGGGPSRRDGEDRRGRDAARNRDISRDRLRRRSHSRSRERSRSRDRYDRRDDRGKGRDGNDGDARRDRERR